MKMTMDQLLFVVTRIHDWDKSAVELVKRAIDLIHDCESAMEAQEDVNKMMASGRSLDDMLQECFGKDRLATMGLPPGLRVALEDNPLGGA